jgi:tripartite-type tricarboxylate transporter receptor subunit TctC
MNAKGPDRGRRNLVGTLAGAVLASTVMPRASWPQGAFPSKTIAVVSPFAPGGLNDMTGNPIRCQ